MSRAILWLLFRRHRASLFLALLLPVAIGVNDALSQAQLAGQDIFAFDPKSRGAQHYRALADELLERTSA